MLKNKKTALIFSGSFFLFVSILHTARLVFKEQAAASLGFTEPAWYSVLSGITCFAAAIWMFAAAN